MKVLSGLVGIGAMAAAVLPLSSKAVAEDLGGEWKSITYSSPTLATGPWVAVGGIVYSGEIEAGGIGFIDRPQNQIRTSFVPNPLVSAVVTGFPIPGQWGFTRPESRAKFEEYGNINPGLWFDHLTFGAATADGRYFSDFSATHIGNNDQNFFLRLGETGKQYLTLEWDQIPHLLSTTAQSLFGGSNTFLTAPDLHLVCPSTGVANAAAAQACAAAIQANLHTMNLGIQRDKGTVTYRSTPDEKSEFKVEYSHERRWGTQETGITSGTATGGIGPGGTAFQVPMPIADTTQDARASYQYTGTSPWGMRFTGSAQYGVSIFRNDLASFEVQNPFINSATGNATPGYLNQYSLYPDNMAQSFTGTVGADLPSKSRYMGTFSYTMMRQNDPFMAQTSSANIFGFGGALVPATTVPAPSRGSLDGSVNTMLFNNVLTTQITPELKNKLSYRYYSYDNNTPTLLMQQWVVGDTTNACTASASYCPHVTQFSSNTKQNAGEELTWRASNWLTTGINYGWEHIDYTLANAKATNENSGKLFADAKAADWLTVRTSYQYAVRNSDNYNYLANVWGPITNGNGNPAANCAVPSTTAAVGTCAGNGGIEINPLMRVFMLADRVRQKGNVYLDIETSPSLVFTPTFGMKLDRYNDPAMTFLVPGAGTANTIGLKQDNDINAGIDMTAQLTSSAKLITSYMYEAIDRTFLWATGNTTPASNLANYDRVSSKDFVHTISAKLAIELKPQVLDLVLGYSISRALETGGGVTCAGTVAQCSSGANLALANSVPNATNTYQLFESTLKYKFDQDQMKAMGWMGQGYMKLRYAYEMNHVSNWQSDSMMPYMYAVAPTGTTGGNKVWMAGDNPNYSAQLIMATLGLTW